MFWVVEIQQWKDGTWHSTTFQYEDRNHAEAKFHAILSEASVAEIPVNGAVLFDDKGIYYRREVYDRRTEQ